VLDVGAGTGKLTRALLAAGHEVVAVEPDEVMRGAFVAALPGVEVLPGTAEALPVADSSFDMVAAGQAFHWFEPESALPEFARVLRPHGTLSVIWNVRDESVPWVAELGQVLGGEDGSVALVEDDPDDLGPLFGPVLRCELSHEHLLTPDGLVGLAASRSHTITLAEPARAVLLERVAAIARREAARSGSGLVRLPYITHCRRAATVDRLDTAARDR
jgi:SAM-dependent methyltransferase